MHKLFSSARYLLLTLGIIFCLAILLYQGMNIVFISNIPECVENLTVEQALEDFDYFWETLEMNYPLFPVVERIQRIDCLEIKKAYRKKLAKKKDINEYEFYTLMGDLTNEMGGIGHLTIANPISYENLKDSFSFGDERLGLLTAYSAFLGEEQTEDVYAWLSKAPDFRLQKLSAFSSWIYQKNSSENVSFKEIDDKTSIIRIQSFYTQYLERDKSKIECWLDAHKSNTNLIIDIRSNPGGNGVYWVDNIIAPLLAKPLKYQSYYFVSNGPDYVENFSVENPESMDLTEVLELPKLHDDDIKDLVLCQTEIDIDPSHTNPLFNGEIYVLTDESTCSAGVQFSALCKATGFATLIGTRTNSDGGGITPMWKQLPNSKLIFSYRITYSLNPDGSCNQETGVFPDVYAKDAMKACLNEIKKRAN